MELHERQKLTIEHLKKKGIKKPQEIITYCLKKMTMPKKGNHRKTPHLRVPGRKHSRKYYQQIIDYYKQKVTP